MDAKDPEDNVREDLNGRNIELTRIGEAARNRDLEESCKMEERK